MMNNLEVIQKMYKDFKANDIPSVMAAFDKDIVFVRPGAPAIPFSGEFRGFEGLKMFTSVAQTVKIKEFLIKHILANENTVAVIGEDHADVLATGKSYNSKWVYHYTLKEGKIIYVLIYLDTLELAEAFKP
jgi:ketosteroid isomerase-like protein